MLILGCIFAFSACKKEDPQQQQPTENPSLSGKTVKDDPIADTPVHALLQKIQTAGASGDAETIRYSFLSGTDKEREFVDVITNVILKEYAFEDAVRAKLGDEAWTVFSDEVGGYFPLPERSESWWNNLTVFDGNLVEFPWIGERFLTVTEEDGTYFFNLDSTIPENFIFMLKSECRYLLFGLEDTMEMLERDDVDIDAVIENYIDCVSNVKPDLRPNNVANNVDAPAREDQSTPEKMLEKMNRSFVEKDEAMFLECIAGKDEYIELAKTLFKLQLVSWDFYTAMKAAYGEEGWRKFVDEPGTNGISGTLTFSPQELPWWKDGTLIVQGNRAAHTVPEDYPREFQQNEWSFLVRSGENWYYDLPSSNDDMEAVRGITMMMNAMIEGTRKCIEHIGVGSATPADISAELGHAIGEALSKANE